MPRFAALDRLAGSSVSVERGEHVWSFVFEGGAVLVVECLWRIRSEGRVQRVSEDDGQWFGLAEPVDAEKDARALLGAKRVVSLDLDDGSGDLTIGFDGGAVLEILSSSSGYEAWQLIREGRTLLVCQGGGNVVEGIDGSV